jgi:hypothetical protein
MPAVRLLFPAGSKGERGGRLSLRGEEGGGRKESPAIGIWRRNGGENHGPFRVYARKALESPPSYVGEIE